MADELMRHHSSLGPNLVYQYVYKGVTCGPYAGKLSALVVTSSGDVYGAGTNTIVRSYTYNDEYPMQEGAGPVLNHWVKIQHLSGLGIRKIVMGDGFGAALTIDNDLLTWGQGLTTFLRHAVIMFEVDGFGTSCSLCSETHNYDLHIIGRVPFNYCQVTESYRIYTAEHPPPEGVQVRRFLRVIDEFEVNCFKCQTRMTPKSVNYIPLNHCASCNLLWDVDEYTGFFENHLGKYPINRLVEIEDIEPYPCGIRLLREGNKVGWISFDQKTPEWVECRFPHPNKFTSVHGAEQIVVRTNTGAICEVTVVDLEDFSYSVEDIHMPARVVQICSGWQSIACLLEDKTIWVLFYGHPPKQLFSCDKRGSFKGIAAAQWCDTYYVQSDGRSETILMEVPESDRKILFTVSGGDCTTKLLKSVCLQPVPSSSTNPSISVPLPPFLIGLYGQKQLSDLTFKLANGDFPAHRSVLMSSSRYFRKILSSNTNPHVTMDMSSYNPAAYKSLLKYFYQNQPDDLDLDGLLDLLLIANSYEEKAIADDVEGKLKDKIKTDNLLLAYGISHMLNIENIKTYCECLMRSPAFKDRLLEKALQDPMMFLMLLKS